MILPKGDSLTFKCKTAHPTEAKWYFNHGPLLPNVKEFGNALHISDATRKNKGYYECLGIAHNFSYFSAIGYVKIKSKLIQI